MRIGATAGDVIAMEIEVKGSTEPYQVLLEPYAVIIPGEIFISSTTRRKFKVYLSHFFFTINDRYSNMSSHNLR